MIILRCQSSNSKTALRVVRDGFEPGIGCVGTGQQVGNGELFAFHPGNSHQLFFAQSECGSAHQNFLA